MAIISGHNQFSPPTELFRFCLRILELRRPFQKINDQHLGQLLNLSPSDTSHWKRGKKILKDTKHITTLAESLNVDSEILQELADGSLNLKEAWCEFYDSEESCTAVSAINSAHHHHSKKLEFFAQTVLSKMAQTDLPVCVHTLVQVFPFIRLLPSDAMNKLALGARTKPGSYVIRHHHDDTRPHTRLAIVREIAHILLVLECDKYASLCNPTGQNTRADVIELSNAFLMPSAALASEMRQVSTQDHLMHTLAAKFSVPKSAIRKRLTTLLCQSATLPH